MPLDSNCSRQQSPATAPAATAPESQNQLVFFTAECSVCLDRFQEHHKAIRLNCGHLFHEECIRSWLGMSNACPLCNARGARDTMKKVQVALVNDAARLREVNVYIERGAIPLIRMHNLGLCLTQNGREFLIEVAIRRSLFRVVSNRYPNAGRMMKCILLVLVYIAAAALAVPANAIVQTALVSVFNAFEAGSILNAFEHIGSQVQPFLACVVMLTLLAICCIGYRAETVTPAPLTGEFHAENIYKIPEQQMAQPALTVVVLEVEHTQSKSTTASTFSTTLHNPTSNSSRRMHKGTLDEQESKRCLGGCDCWSKIVALLLRRRP